MRTRSRLTTLLDGHAKLDIQCLDRIYLNNYVPILQTGAPVVALLSTHLGFPFPSPALFNQIGQRFRRAVDSYAVNNDILWITFGRADDELATTAPHLRRQAATGRSGVAGIGITEEFQRVWGVAESIAAQFAADRRRRLPQPGRRSHTSPVHVLATLRCVAAPIPTDDGRSVYARSAVPAACRHDQPRYR